MSTTPTFERLRQALQRELDPGETILWEGTQCEDLVDEGSKVFVLSCFAIASILSMCIFGAHLAEALEDWRQIITSRTVKEPGYWSYFWSRWTWVWSFTPLLLASFSFLAYPSRRKLSRQQIYAVTNMRAIDLRIDLDNNIHEQDYNALELAQLSRFERPDGRGNLTIDGARGAYSTSQTASGHGFRYIENVLEVERMLRKQFGDS